MRPRARVSALGVVMALATACSMKGAGVIPPVSTGGPLTVPGVTTTSSPDEAAGALHAVPGRTTTTAPSLHPGRAGLSGTVTGPSGPVASATVRVERLVARSSARVDVVTGGDGRWAIDDLPGGSYRVRAWRAPDLTSGPAQFFLGSAEQRDVPLGLTALGGTRVATSVPGRLALLTPFPVSVRLTTPAVDAQGVVQQVPEHDVNVALGVGGALVVLSPARVRTDATGTARWQVYCAAGGDTSASVTLPAPAPGGPGDVRPLNVPKCPEPVTVPPPTPPPPPSPDDVTGPGD